MSTSGSDQQFDDLPEAEVEGKRKGLSIVWLLPIIALLVGGWLIYKTVSEKGPGITVSFETAEGVEEGKTVVKLKDIKVGTVDTVKFSKDLSRVLVDITMAPGSDPYLTDKTRFWVVRPRVGAGQVSGLGTLFSGAYIAMDPHDDGKATRDFTGLEVPPVLTSDRQGTRYRLRADELGSLSIGAPVYFKQFNVGEVIGYRLSDDHQYVEVEIFIEAPHDGFVVEGAHFWNASGLELSLGATGAELHIESVVSLLSGGIAFEILPELADTPLAAQDHEFVLFKDHKASLEKPITKVFTFALKFDESVRGVDVGAPVEFRGIRAGTVSAIRLGADPTGKTSLIPVILIDIEPERMEPYKTLTGSEAAEKGRQQLREHSIERIRMQVEKYGLRARLQTGNIVTGKRFVELDFFEHAAPATVGKSGEYLELPTMPGSLEGIIGGIQQLLNKLDKADIQGTLVNLNKLMTSTSNLMAALEKDAPGLSKELNTTLVEAQAMFRNATDTLESVDSAASPDGEVVAQLQDALREIAAAARSIRVMAEYLERHPDAMLKGKGAQ